MSLVLPCVDSDGVQLLFDEIASETPSDRIAIIIIDCF